MPPAPVDDATLTGPDLRELLDGTGGAVLRRCTADEPDLRGADLRGADLGGSLFWTRLQLRAAVTDATTVLPAAG